MKYTVRLPIAALLVTAATTAPLTAQQVVLSELRADATERWVELHNRGAVAVDLSTWSLHYATHTPNASQSYWWPFPAGATLLPDGYLRVFWFQDVPASPAPGALYTGTSPNGFLFWLGGEQMLASGAAFALLDTQLGTEMGTPAHYVDWVSYGDHGFAREPLAAQNGTWTAGVHTVSIPADMSLARDEARIGAVPTHDQQWFVDPTPTPMAPNLAGAATTAYGQACAVPGHHLLGDPQLIATSLPLIGNAQFGYEVSNTTGFYGETMLLAFSAHAAPNGQPTLLPPYPGSTCIEAIDTGALIGSLLVPTRITRTPVPMSLAAVPAALAGVQLHVQAVVFDWLPNAYPPFQGLSNALAVVIDL